MRQNKVIFYGDNYSLSTDHKGRVTIPQEMVRGRDERIDEGIFDGDPFYIRKEDYGLYVTFLSDELENHFLDLPENSLDRRRFFQGAVNYIDKYDRRSSTKRLTLDGKLDKINVILEPNGDFFKVLINKENKSNLDWGNFRLGK
jgi:hypothetical protein